MVVNQDADKLQATANDPRKTPLGNFIRNTSIDEIPQLINVFLGNMSLVGPRPHMVKHTEMYSKLIDNYMDRHTVKPGITGWAQVTGLRGETKELSQMENRVKADIWYIQNWSFLLDMKILMKTFQTILLGDKNAY
jgi:putative colanic acid biosynthesis UDP-glucose lipid carrier transferase